MPSLLSDLLNVEKRPEKVPPVRGELPFTLADIRAAVPPELFKANIPLSWYYIARDLFTLVATAFATNFILSFVENQWIRGAIWVAYTIIQGATGFGLWVIGHECGHQGYFGDGHWLNDPVGYVIHSAYCDPYHSWRITHATHHRFTNNKELDTAFPPKDYPAAGYEIAEFVPIVHLFMIAMYVLLGWPMYIFANLEGHRYETIQNHFNPNAPMFQKRDRTDVLVSDLGVVAMLAVLATLVNSYGLSNILYWYGLGWLGTHSWLVIVTFLQHSDGRVPHYDEEDNFNFVKGAIATVDRNYGWVFNNMMHHITDAHLVHHVFSRIPFYQAKKATPYVAKVLGKYYVFDNRHLILQMWEAWFSHQTSFFESKMWTKKNPGKSRNNFPTKRAQKA